MDVTQAHKGKDNRPALLDGLEAKAAIVLWASGHFDTKDIADVLNAREDAVCRILAASRDVMRGM